MTDTLTRAQRSERMSRVKGKNTKPEVAVRRLLARFGIRPRLDYRRLPGTPDMALPRRKKVIWVHGCFWHRHPGCRNARLPKSRLDFWKPKLLGNRRRDLRNQRELRRSGWRYLVVWECQLRRPKAVTRKLRRFLEK
jgi:DNA mismatch endonuclease (patch repair protein)